MRKIGTVFVVLLISLGLLGGTASAANNFPCKPPYVKVQSYKWERRNVAVFDKHGNFHHVKQRLVKIPRGPAKCLHIRNGYYVP